MMFKIAAVSTFLASASLQIATAEDIVIPTIPPTPSGDTECTLCYDYSDFEVDLGPNQCSEIILFKRIRAYHKAQHKATGQKCKFVGGKKPDSTCGHKGFERELLALTNTHSVTEARAALQAMCDAQLDAAAQSELPAGGSWGSLGVDMNDYIAGQGFLNLETGNLQQEDGDFARDPDRFIYKGEDPTLNDHYPTTAESYAAGNAIKAFYDNEAKNSLLSVPTDNFVSDTEDEETPKMCAETNAAICCWHRDRQYFDQNGDCGARDCANADPGDNTDLCWTEDKEGTVFPYPGSATEQDLHCHGFAWGNELEGAYDLNGELKWNNLFFVSLYDHLYTRGYAESITNDPSIAGEQAMCGCVEDMAPIARADCTEAVGSTNTTLSFDSDTQRLQVDFVSGTFNVKFQACQGYDYVEDFGPDDFAETPNAAAELDASNNDLAAFVFRLYLEGKISEDQTEVFADTIIGYTDPSVNDGDDEREAACEAAFKEAFGEDAEYVEKEIEVNEDEENEED